MKTNDLFHSNTVKANNQVTDRKFFYGDDNPNIKIMFAGNSITRHAPKLEIGWPNCWGMAASSADKDYVHLVIKHFEKLYDKVGACIYNAASWEMDFTNNEKLDELIDGIKEYHPDILVIRLGENFKKDLLNDITLLKNIFDTLIKEAKKYSKYVLITSLFWHHELLDEAIKESAEENNIPYVYITDLGNRNECLALGKFEHPGVAIHPGDLGMKLISERIINAIDLK